jgi:hypothetical protein
MGNQGRENFFDSISLRRISFIVGTLVRKCCTVLGHWQKETLEEMPQVAAPRSRAVARCVEHPDRIRDRKSVV